MLTKQRMEDMIRAYGMEPVYSGAPPPRRIGRPVRMHRWEQAEDEQQVAVEREDVQLPLGTLEDVLAMSEPKLQLLLSSHSSIIAQTLMDAARTQPQPLHRGWNDDDGGGVA